MTPMCFQLTYQTLNPNLKTLNPCLDAGASSIDELVLIDRETDAVTPMCTQLTYQTLNPNLKTLNPCLDAGASSIDELVLIDRETDAVTPMCTQLTYEGLLDEVLGIKNGSVSLDPGGAL